MKLRLAIAAATVSGLLAAPAFASTWVASGSGSDGALSAQAVITSSANSLNIALSSLLANPKSAGQEVSGIEIFLDGGAPGSVSLASASGVLINIGSGGAFTVDNADTITHWGTAISGGAIFLATAGTGSQGGKPIDLIIDGGGNYSNANPSITGRNPQIQGTGTFVLTLTGEPNPNITGVKFLFGTSPDTTLTGNCIAGCTPGGIPEPTSWALMLVGFGGLGAALRTRRRRVALAA